MTEEPIASLGSADHVLKILRGHGLKQSLTPAVLAVAAELAEPRGSRAEVVSQARQFFTDRTGLVPIGLEELPSCWLRQLPALLWNGHKPGEDMLPYMVLRLAFEEGALGVAFLQEPPNDNGRVTCWDRLRLLLNLFLVPNLWRPLTREEELEIWTRRPELRRELFTLED
jgi:hypothetical protein